MIHGIGNIPTTCACGGRIRHQHNSVWTAKCQKCDLGYMERSRVVGWTAVEVKQ